MFAEFLYDKRYGRNQIEFVNLIVDELTAQGAVDTSQFMRLPTMGIAPEEPDTFFAPADLDRVFDVIS